MSEERSEEGILCSGAQPLEVIDPDHLSERMKAAVRLAGLPS